MTRADTPSFRTADLFDEHSSELQVVEPLFRHFGGLRHFCGPLRTVSTHEDNSMVRSVLETPGHGNVLVVDGIGSLRVALVGDQLGALAIDNGWSGIVVHGCVRDIELLARMPVGIMALAAVPSRGRRQGQGQADVPLRFGQAMFTPGHWLYADADGIVLCERKLVS